MKLLDIIRCAAVFGAGAVSAVLGLAAIRNKRLFTLKKYEHCTKESIAKASKAEGTLLMLIAVPLIGLAAAEVFGAATAPVVIGILCVAAILLVLLYLLPKKYLKLKKS